MVLAPQSQVAGVRSLPMRYVAAGFRVLRPFSRVWVSLFLVAVFLTLGFGGGTPNTPTWLVLKFSVLGLLAAGVLGVLASKVRC